MRYAAELRIDGAGRGAEHMRRDAELLRLCAEETPTVTIRLYWFVPACLSLGRLEPLSDANADACARDGVDIVRRPSGGRAVLHHDEVTYAVVCPGDDPVFGGDVMTSCARIHGAVAAGLRSIGVQTTPHVAPATARRSARSVLAGPDCFARPAAHELLDEHGAKLVGSAQARRGGALLQHGSVLLEPSRAAVYLHAPAPAGSPEVPAGSRGLRALAGRDLSREQVASALAGGFHLMMCARPLDTTA